MLTNEIKPKINLLTKFMNVVDFYLLESKTQSNSISTFNSFLLLTGTV